MLLVLQDYFYKPMERTYLLQSQDGQSTYEIIASNSMSPEDLMANLKTGQDLSVTGPVMRSEGRAPQISVDTLTINRQPTHTERGRPTTRRKLQQGTTTTSLPVTRASMNTLILPISFEGCAKDGAGTVFGSPGFVKTDVEKAFFGDGTTAGNMASVGGQYNWCSYGKTSLTKSNSVVAPVVKINSCTGTTACDAFWTWMDEAVQGAKNAGKYR